MTPVGMGIDVVDVARVARMLARSGERTLARVLTADERAYCETQAGPARHVAARIAAKEAAFKAFQAAGARGLLAWREVEVQREPHGEPTLAFHGRAAQQVRELGVARALVSLSHSDAQAVAVVMLMS
jgi:holo-[acyl-carrier protein] synthase